MIFYATLPMLGFLEAAATPMFWIFTYPFLWAALLVVLRFAGRRSRSSFDARLPDREGRSGAIGSPEPV
jgi:hypothetical protein